MGNAACRGVYGDVCCVAALSKNRLVLDNDVYGPLQAHTSANKQGCAFLPALEKMKTFPSLPTQGSAVYIS